MKKAEIVKHIGELFEITKNKTEDGKGMTHEETKELYDKLFYLYQQATK